MFANLRLYMKTQSDYKVSSNLAILIIGEPKAGHTRLAASFPNPYFLEVDNNLDSAVRVLAGKKFWYDTPTLDVKDKTEVWKKSLEFLVVAMKNPEIQTIVIDSLSMLAEFMCLWIVSEHKRTGDIDKSGKPIEAMTIPDYGKLLSMFRSLIFDLRLSGKTIIANVHKQSYQDENTKVWNHCLALPGQAKDTLGAAFTDCWAVVKEIQPGNKVKFFLKTEQLMQYPPIGRSIPTMAPSFDVTDKTPAEIQAILAPILAPK